MSRRFNSRPSDLFSLKDPLAAYYFDRAVWTFGSRVEREIEEASQAKTEQGKAMKLAIVQNKWLGVSKFASPANYRGRRERTAK
jgi:hypothetical protein